MSIEELVNEAGARADSVSPFVIELIRSLEDRIAKLEGTQEPAKPSEEAK